MELPDGRAFARGDGLRGGAAGHRLERPRSRPLPGRDRPGRDDADVVAAVRPAAADGHADRDRARAATAGPRTTCATAGCCSTSPASTRSRSTGGAGTAIVGPGVKGHELCDRLAAVDRFFPAGHCRGVAVGGYLLQGGYGWNSRVARAGVRERHGIDVVTATGELVHADATRERRPVLVGPGRRARVLRRGRPLPSRGSAAPRGVRLQPLRVPDRGARGRLRLGARDRPRGRPAGRDADPHVGAFEPLGIEGPAIVIASPGVRRLRAGGRGGPRPPRQVPRPRPGAGRHPLRPDRAFLLVRRGHARLPGRPPLRRGQHVDLRAVRRPPPRPARHRRVAPAAAVALPVAQLGAVARPRADMAYSMEDDIYLALYAVWTDPADDDRHGAWPVTNMAAMEHLATGVQLADENLGQRPARFVTDEHMARLDDPGRARSGRPLPPVDGTARERPSPTRPAARTSATATATTTRRSPSTSTR